MRDRSIPEDKSDLWISPAPSPAAPIDVTIVIPTYQNEATLRRAVRSVIEQSLHNIEIIVGDDAFHRLEEEIDRLELSVT